MSPLFHSSPPPRPPMPAHRRQQIHGRIQPMPAPRSDFRADWLIGPMAAILAGYLVVASLL